MMYGQMTAGSWIYIGTQGILQGTYETFASARKHALRATRPARHGWSSPAGLGGMGGAQPLAATMNGGVFLGVEVDPHAHPAPLETRYLDERRRRSRRRARRAVDGRATKARPRSIGLVGNAADVYPELVKRGVMPDLVTDQTSAHDPLDGYVPPGLTLDAAPPSCASAIPEEYIERRPRVDGACTCSAMIELQQRGASRFDYGNNLRGQARDEAACERRLRIPRLRAGLHPAAVLRGQGPVPLGGALGRSRRHPRHRRGRARAFPQTTPICTAGSSWPQERVAFQGLPARICWLGYGERAPRGPAVQRARRAPARSRRRSSSAAITSTAARSRRRTARPRR